MDLWWLILSMSASALKEIHYYMKTLSLNDLIIGPPVTTLCCCNMSICGIIVGGIAVVTISITATFIIVTVVLIRSKRVLKEEIHHLKAKANEELAIYEEIVRDSPKSSSPSIDTGENTAYISATVNRIPH